VGEDLFIAGGMGSATLNVPSLRVDEEVLVDTFDPMTLSSGKARVKCVGEEVLEILGERVRTKVIVTNIQGITSKAWVTDDEEVVRAETPLGLYLQKIAPEEALMSAKSEGGAPGNAQAGADLIESVAVRSSGKTPHRGATRMTVRLTSPAQTPLSDDVQRVEGEQVTIVAPAEPAGPVAAPQGMDEFLGSDALIQASHPRIKEMAAQIVGGETDAWRKARKIHDWVFENIEKVPVFSIPSALETLETREGDCNEHAVLYTALARAAGVPARVACGLLWSDELQGFYYHAWPEVWAGKWVWVDPTFGQPIADATHIKLVSGSIEQWPQLAAYIGQLKLEVVEVE
ncbi:MAG: transglutaminase-like domain-containing protein, partial [Candidatus Hydrogenedentes bacterium]|nr:transglutaminase-like domain-containing protein [Candidatus Hydrogenedentota bacterium]